MIEAGLRSAYLLFNRSTTRIKELKKLQGIYGKIQFPTSIVEIRWISKFQAVEALTNPTTMVLMFDVPTCEEEVTIISKPKLLGLFVEIGVPKSTRQRN